LAGAGFGAAAGSGFGTGGGICARTDAGGTGTGRITCEPAIAGALPDRCQAAVCCCCCADEAVPDGGEATDGAVLDDEVWPAAAD